MTQQEINEKYFGKAAISAFTLNEKQSKRAFEILTKNSISSEMEEKIKQSNDFFKNLGKSVSNA